MSDELQRGDEWIRARLLADSATTTLVGQRVYATKVPSTGTFPCVRFTYFGGVDTRGTGAIRILHAGLWLIEALAEVRDWNASPLGPLTDRIDALFDRASTGAAGSDGTVFTSTRTDTFRDIEDLPGGGERRRAGGFYRLLIQVP